MDSRAQAVPSRRFDGWRCVAWLFVGLAAAPAIAWLVIQVEKFGYQPIGLTSTAIGAFLGGLLVLLARLLPVGHRVCLLGGTFIVALFLVASIHIFAYLDYRGGIISGVKPVIAPEANGIGPVGLGRYLSLKIERHGWFLLILDAALTTFSAVILMGLATAPPFLPKLVPRDAKRRVVGKLSLDGGGRRANAGGRMPDSVSTLGVPLRLCIEAHRGRMDRYR